MTKACGFVLHLHRGTLNMIPQARDLMDSTVYSQDDSLDDSGDTQSSHISSTSAPVPGQQL